ncbi:uncharacterized protein F4822DRAFT_439224 [Hypoxylon trugodes]|uniref:uncharacterized protein n=1 Tax=Hypoxylon trugodes TaxID=326681 RepID=UPI00219ACDD8|nr:uncharacterized protein F4822DRAFT_439224 [Hypoxylon trugodes]KAI1382884.1 hypothetical protein F4822DRAFT_439224 [Hypoxylon trugodes]
MPLPNNVLATMDPNLDVVKRSFRTDVLKRKVVNTSAKEPCSCGLYQYYSHKCGCIYKSVHFKCGKTTSEKTGDRILCPSGRGRKIRVNSAIVPFNCAQCRRNGNRSTY